MTSPRTDLTARIKDVLAGHVRGATVFLDDGNFYVKCSCGDAVGTSGDGHRAHLASVLTDTVAGEMAEAWKQGCLAVCNGGIDECGHSEPHMHPEDNPYVRQAGDGQ